MDDVQHARALISEIRLNLEYLAADDISKVTDVGFKMPSISGANKSLAHTIAYDLSSFDFDELEVKENRQKAYVNYTKTKSKLKKAYTDRKEAERALLPPPTCKVTPFHKARVCRDTYRNSKVLPLSDQVLHPVAMPVEVSEHKELAEFFEVLRSGKPAIGISADEIGVYDKYFKGAYYTDGRIDLCKQVVGPQHIHELLQSIRDNPNVEHFLLGNNIVGPSGAIDIANFIKDKTKKCNIKTWYLAGNSIDATGMQAIAEALAYDTHCESLWLKRNPIGVEGAKAVAEMLKMNETIRVLDLDNCAIMDEGCKAVVEALYNNNNTLKSLYLDANGLTDVSGEYFRKYFLRWRDPGDDGIEYLSLSVNRLGDAGAIAIASALVSRSYELKSLTIGSNRIELDGLKSLLMLEELPCLEVLDIGYYKAAADMGELPNSFGDEGAREIAKFILSNSSVKYLGFHNTHITEKGLEMIAAVMPFNDSLMLVHGEQASVVQRSVARELTKKITDCYMKNRTDDSVDYKKYLRELKHGPLIGWIDSIYRNNM